MQGQKARNARVLYATPVGEGLQSFCEDVRRVFVDAGLVREEGRGLLVHCTVVNWRGGG